MKFGAQLSSPCQVVDLDTGGAQLSVMLSDGTTIESRAVLIATGAHYKTLPLQRWIDFEGGESTTPQPNWKLTPAAPNR